MKLSRDKSRLLHFQASSSNNMASKSFTTGDVCSFWKPGEIDRTIFVNRLSSPRGPMNPGIYSVTCLQTGMEFETPGCWLTQLEVNDLVLPEGMELDFSTTPEVTQTKDEVPPVEAESSPPAKKSRFAQCSEVEVDEIASGRLSTNTQEQTRWAVAIFRGIIRIYSTIFTNPC